jgi:hypothetical protein
LNYVFIEQVLESLVLALIHPKKMLSGPNAKTAIILAILSSLQTRRDRAIELQKEDISSTASALLRCRDLCTNILKQSHTSAKLTESSSDICALLNFPIVAQVCLKWISIYLETDVSDGSDNFSILLPIFLQILQDVSEKHILQRKDSFDLLVSIMMQSRSRITEFSEANKAECDCLDCIMFIMGTGYVTAPMKFLLEISPKLGVPVVSYLISVIFEIIKPPLSQKFFEALKALILQNEKRCSFEALTEERSQKLYIKLDEIKNAANSTQVTLKGIVLLRLTIPEALNDKEAVASELFGDDDSP